MIDYKQRLLDSHAGEKLDDGRTARELNVHELNRALIKMGVERVDSFTGKDDALDRLAEHNERKRAAAEAALDRLRNGAGHSNQGAALIEDIKARARI